MNVKEVTSVHSDCWNGVLFQGQQFILIKPDECPYWLLTFKPSMLNLFIILPADGKSCGAVKCMSIMTSGGELMHGSCTEILPLSRFTPSALNRIGKQFNKLSSLTTGLGIKKKTICTKAVWKWHSVSTRLLFELLQCSEVWITALALCLPGAVHRHWGTIHTLREFYSENTGATWL